MGRAALAAVACLMLAGPVRAAPADPAGPAAAPTRYCHASTGLEGKTIRVCVGLADYDADVCMAISRYAALQHLPPGFFARLIWQESRFDPNAASPAGAEGISQFIPSTARLEGVINVYDPAEALARSARYLRALTDKFGNLGLAAAAYNGGEGAVARFIAGTGPLAVETLDYVRIVTGYPVTDWLADSVKHPDFSLQPGVPFQEACLDLARNAAIRSFTPPSAPPKPWGVQLAENFSRAVARASFTRVAGRLAFLSSVQPMLVATRNPHFGRRLRYAARIGQDTRAEADRLCARIRGAGLACIVIKN